MTTTQIMQAINAVSQRVNDLSQRMDAHFGAAHKENAENIDTNATGIDDLAGMIEMQNEALNDLATAVAEMEGE